MATVLLVSCWAFLPEEGHRQQPSDPLPSLVAQDILLRMNDNHSSIESVEVVYTASGYTSEYLDPDTYLRRHIAMRYPNHLYYLLAHGSPTTHWRKDPFAQCTLIHGTEHITEYTGRRMYIKRSIAERARLPGTLRDEIYFISTGVWPSTRVAPRPISHPAAIPEILSSKAYTSVDSRQHSVNGYECYKVTAPHRESLWISPSLGYSLVAREQYDGSGHLMVRYDNSDYERVSGSVWLPRIIRFREYAGSSATSGTPLLYNDATITVDSCGVNCVPLSVFRHKLKPGMVRIDVNGEIDQVAPGGSDYREDVKSYATRRLRDSATAESGEASEGRVSPFLVAIMVVLYVLAVEVVLWRRRVGHASK